MIVKAVLLYPVIDGIQGGESTMAFKISDECISCGACEPECPVQAISEGEGKYDIDPEKCIDCGACADVCPVGAPAQE